MGKLTPRQQRFVEEYLRDLNAAAAARRAGYSEHTARSQGQRLLTKVDVQELIQQGADARAKRCEIDSDYVLRKTDELLCRCMQEIEPLTADGVPVLDKEGRAIFKFDSAGAARALKLLGDHVSVNAYGPGALKPVDPEATASDVRWTVEIVHMTKDDYYRAIEKPPIEHNP